MWCGVREGRRGRRGREARAPRVERKEAEVEVAAGEMTKRKDDAMFIYFCPSVPSVD